jgi:transcriptional regulator with XRE-family HTH domain
MTEEQARTFGAYIRHHREQKKLSIRELARKASLDSGAVTRLEHGKVHAPQPDTLTSLATVLEAPLADLFAMAHYVTPKDLPSMTPYLRARYGHLPEAMFTDVSDYFEQLAEDYELDANGPQALEDETIDTQEDTDLQ